MSKPKIVQGLAGKRRRPAGPPPPAPEVIDGGDWEIRQSAVLRQAGTWRHGSRPGGSMVVPYGDSEQARLVRAHELTHVQISPKEWPRDYDERIMQLLEDARVHAHMRATGFDLAELREVLGESEVSPEQLMKTHPAVLVGLALATWGTGEWERVKSSLDGIERGDLVEFARRLVDHFGLNDPTNRPEVGTLGELADMVVRAFGDPDADNEPEDPDEEPGVRPDLERLEVSARETASYEFNEWGSMTIEHVPLPRRLPSKLRERRKLLPDLRGRRLRRVGRLHVDGRVFTNKQRSRGGGSVLIDVSGSMSLSSEQIERIVQALPGGIVAVYAGSGRRGTLRIVAKNGRYCEQRNINLPMGGNIVDGPALRWLGEQSGPRYWVSDGGVTGVADQSCSLLTREAMQICKEKQILRVPSAAVLLGD